MKSVGLDFSKDEENIGINEKKKELGSDRHVGPAGLCHLATLIPYPSFSSFLNAAKSGMKYMFPWTSRA